jgi:hypothetical protein
MIAILVVLAGLAEAQGEHAVVRIPSHGGSGTVIETRPGRSLILSAAHLFSGSNRYKRMTFDMPSPAPGQAQRVESRLLALDSQMDLSLIEIDVGPLPYVCAVAPQGYRPGECISVGYDNMRLPPQKRPAHIASQSGPTTFTRERPWHGRSGGALIDRSRGYLVGVVSGYSSTRGVYASHSAVLSFLARSRDGRGQPLPVAPGRQQSPSPYGRAPPFCAGGS